jgi:hypothetical protein
MPIRANSSMRVLGEGGGTEGGGGGLGVSGWKSLESLLGEPEGGGGGGLGVSGRESLECSQLIFRSSFEILFLQRAAPAVRGLHTGC